MRKRYQVFVSSTYMDLIEERKEVSQAILKCDCFPAGMEIYLILVYQYVGVLNKRGGVTPPLLI